MSLALDEKSRVVGRGGLVSRDLLATWRKKCDVCELHQATGKREIFCKTSVKHIIRRAFGMY